MYRSLVQSGIFRTDDLADAFGMSENELKESLPPGYENYANFERISQKARLNKIAQDLAMSGEKGDLIRLAAVKYLLETIHDQYAMHARYARIDKFNMDYDKAKQVIEAAKCANQWDDKMTQKFIKNIKEIGEDK